MINTKDQEELFELVSKYLEADIECYALGGTAMMFYGYKNTTKDIDLLFQTTKEINTFIKAIKQLGYKERSIKGIYPEKRLKLKSKPIMFTRGDERFDLFLNNIFGFNINENIKERCYSRQDFIGTKELIIKILSKEDIILLKAITGREKDFEDIQTIIEQDKDINWDVIIDEAIIQRKHKEWILIDLEETMKQLKKITFLPSKLFKKIYAAEEKM
ncbi:MAG: nucleotidyltransferase [archaeon]